MDFKQIIAMATITEDGPQGWGEGHTPVDPNGKLCQIQAGKLGHAVEIAVVSNR